MNIEENKIIFRHKNCIRQMKLNMNAILWYGSESMIILLAKTATLKVMEFTQ